MRFRLGFIGILIMLCIGVVSLGGFQSPNQKIVLNFESDILQVDEQLEVIGRHLESIGAVGIQVDQTSFRSYTITYASDESLYDVQNALNHYNASLNSSSNLKNPLLHIVVQDISAPSSDWNLTDVPMIEVRREYLRAPYQPVLNAYLESQYCNNLTSQPLCCHRLYSSNNHTSLVLIGLPETRAGPLNDNLKVDGLA